MKHILICGAKGVGKSTLIRRLCMAANAPIYGYCTKMLSTADADSLFPIYIHPAWQAEAERAYGSANLIGRCDGRMHDVHTNVFDNLGANYIAAAKPGGYIIMDELGFMEKNAEAFKRAVFNALDGDIPVIAAVKARYDVDFLNRVRAHEKAQLYTITPENRDALYAELLGIITR